MTIATRKTTGVDALKSIWLPSPDDAARLDWSARPARDTSACRAGRRRQPALCCGAVMEMPDDALAECGIPAPSYGTPCSRMKPPSPPSLRDHLPPDMGPDLPGDDILEWRFDRAARVADVGRVEVVADEDERRTTKAEWPFHLRRSSFVIRLIARRLRRAARPHCPETRALLDGHASSSFEERRGRAESLPGLERSASARSRRAGIVGEAEVVARARRSRRPCARRPVCRRSPGSHAACDVNVKGGNRILSESIAREATGRCARPLPLSVARTTGDVYRPRSPAPMPFERGGSLTASIRPPTFEPAFDLGQQLFVAVGQLARVRHLPGPVLVGERQDAVKQVAPRRDELSWLLCCTNSRPNPSPRPCSLA